jgi:lysophospholipase L1-like esterase
LGFGQAHRLLRLRFGMGANGLRMGVGFSYTRGVYTSGFMILFFIIRPIFIICFKTITTHMRVICIGDSLTEGYVTKNTSRYYPYSTALRRKLISDKTLSRTGVTVHNVGLSGRTSYQILTNLKRHVPIETYDVAIVLAGTNDLLRRSSAYIVDKLKQIHNHCLNRGVSRVYVLSLPQIHFDQPMREAKRLDVNRQLRAWCNSVSRLTYVPFGEDFVYDPKSPVWAHNGYHLSPSGYRKMGAYMASKMTKT